MHSDSDNFIYPQGGRQSVRMDIPTVKLHVGFEASILATALFIFGARSDCSEVRTQTQD